jgi:hypothetical protein
VAEWTISPEKMAEVPKALIADVRRVYALEIFKRVVERTPVDTGNARSNWLVSVGEQSDEYNPATVTKRKITRGKNKGVTVTKATPHQTFNKTMRAGDLGITFSGDDTIYIQNNTPYIRKLEYGGYPKNPKHGGKTRLIFNKNNEGRLISITGGDPKTINGFSRQAPAGMVGVTMAKAQQLFEKAVATVKGWK